MEASMLCSLKHANIVTLRGVCVEGDNRCTIFDLAANVRPAQLSDMLIISPSKLLGTAYAIMSSLQISSQHRITRHLQGKYGCCRARCGRSWT